MPTTTGRTFYTYTHTHLTFLYTLLLELYEYCLNEGYADKNLIAKWKKVNVELGLASFPDSSILQVTESWVGPGYEAIILGCAVEPRLTGTPQQ